MLAISDLNIPELLFSKNNFWCLSRLVTEIAKYAQRAFSKKIKGQGFLVAITAKIYTNYE